MKNKKSGKTFNKENNHYSRSLQKSEDYYEKQ